MNKSKGKRSTWIFHWVTKTGRNVKVETEGRKRKVKLFCQRMWALLFGSLPQEKGFREQTCSPMLTSAARADTATGSNSEYSPGVSLHLNLPAPPSLMLEFREGRRKNKHSTVFSPHLFVCLKSVQQGLLSSWCCWWLLHVHQFPLWTLPLKTHWRKAMEKKHVT